MVLFNYSTKELTAKVVYYGPGLCGKTTNLQFIHQNLSDTVRGKMLSLATKTDRTLFFDFLPMDLGEIRGMKTRMQLYTVPGQVFYNETRKLVLRGVDGVVFVADSQEEMLGANVESFKNLEENLKTHGVSIAELPHIIQFNKRDLPKLADLDQLNSTVNKYNVPFYESVATTGIGVQDSLKAITKLVLLNLTRKYEPRRPGKAATAVAKATPAVTPATPAPAEIPLADIQVPMDTPVAEIPLAAAPEPSPVETAPEVPPTMPETRATTEATALPVDSAPPEDTPPPVMALDLEEGEPQGLEVPPPVEAAPADPATEVAEELDKIVTELQDAELEAAPTPEKPVEEVSVRLTEVAGDDELFADPSLDVAELDAGQTREILIPVQIGTGEELRRFKLSLSLRLDPLD